MTNRSTLGRNSSHRIAMLKNMVTSLIYHERVMTTTPKAKALRKGKFDPSMCLICIISNRYDTLSIMLNLFSYSEFIVAENLVTYAKKGSLHHRRLAGT